MLKCPEWKLPFLERRADAPFRRFSLQQRPSPQSTNIFKAHRLTKKLCYHFLLRNSVLPRFPGLPALPGGAYIETILSIPRMLVKIKPIFIRTPSRSRRRPRIPADHPRHRSHHRHHPDRRHHRRRHRHHPRAERHHHRPRPGSRLRTGL